MAVLDISLPQAALVGTIAGLSSHWLYFNRGEHHLRAGRLFVLAVSSPFLVYLALQNTTTGLTTSQLKLLSAAAVSSFFTALWGSIVTYRLFFHRLNGFPGPKPLRVSKLVHTWRLYTRRDNYKQLHEMHEEFGDFVRTGPNEVTVFHPDGPTALLGPGSKCTKAAWYDAGWPLLSLHTTRDKSLHDKRRRIWDKGFGAKALRGYESQVQSFTHVLLDQTKKNAGKPLNISHWMHYYSFDVMGSVAFGHSFDMLTSGKTHSALQQLIDAMRPLGLLTPVPWMFCLLAGLPWLGPEKTPFGKLSIESVAERRKKVLDEPDVMSYLIAEADKAVTPKEKDEATRLLGCESRLIIVAGSDTTASTLTFAFYQLAKNPSLIQNLRTELDPLRQANGDFNLKDLEKAEYLNGVINETLRLHPAVPSGVLRMTPKEGITVGGTYIPGHVTVVTPSWTMGRRADCWVKPLEFLPERWAPDSPLILRKDVFAPFSLGWSSCVGKQLALMELRAVLAYLVCNLDIKMAEGESGERLVEESKDYFTLTLAEFDCVFEERKGVGA